MFRDFIAYLETNKLNVTSEKKVLLTVSGGIDSVAMVHLYYCADIPFSIGHCNFKLRGTDSDLDEAFVRQLASDMDVPFHTVSFDTKEFATANKLSIQMAARQLRYEWFEKIRTEHNYEYVATAHHKDDSVETFLLNLSRGTGIRGLHGILPKKDKLIRPLLFADKAAIIRYVQDNDLTYRTDVSNASIKYDRNFVRHKIIPLFQELNPSFIKSLDQTSQKLKHFEEFFDYFFKKIEKEAVSYESDFTKIDLTILRQYPFLSLLLFELLSPFGFNSTQIENIHKALSATTGKTFYATDYQLIIDRENLLIRKIQTKSETHYSLDFTKPSILLNQQESITLQPLEKVPIQFLTGKNKVYLDGDALEFPLQIRHWQAGDYFYPLGMNGKKKKIKDLYTDLKLSQFEKEKVWIITSGENICWVIGHRIDDRYKITPRTRNAIEMIFSKK